MGVCFLYGNGGGSNGSFYKATSGMTAPSNPKVGDIWIKTSIPLGDVMITSEQMSSAPGWLTEGSAIIIAGTGWVDAVYGSSDRRTGYAMTLYPSTCFQCVNGVRMSVNAYFYNYKGAWAQFSKEFAATINITYPAGSTCTVTNGTITYTAPSTSGSWSCVVHNTGTWTVTATNGTQTKSASVSITADGQSQSVTLKYFAATINVSYPAGSTCTVTCGSTSYTAPNTSGSWACTVYFTGTWTVWSSNGSQSASSAVSITSDGQSVSVSLKYEYYVCYAGGTANYTGGWTGLGNVTSIGSDIKCYVDYSWAGCQAFTNGTFSVTNFTKLNVNISAISAIRDQASFGLSLSKPNTVMWNDSFTNKSNCAAIMSITSTGVKTLDISSLFGNYYFWTGQNGTGWPGSSGFTIDKIWLS